MEVCVNIFSSWTTGCGNAGGNYAARRGTWNDNNPDGVSCNVYAAVCELQCTTAQFPIDDSCPYTTNQITTIATAMIQPNFNSGFLPILMAAYPISLKSNISWEVTDIFSWASFERTELNLTEDFVSWYDNSMGNCFTFNHFDSPKIYNLRYAGEYGGFRALTKVNQADALEMITHD
uniref:Uncharacterized protein n=1 Tax=Acrobeloides nanus TaxID=290746 RepID=A0A914DS52_9BILA